MKPAYNAFIGYSYQKSIAFLLLAKMDVERKIKKIQIEADVDHQFDDIVIQLESEAINCQIKDHQKIFVKDISIKGDYVTIKGKPHKISSEKNIIFVKSIKLEHNSEIIGFSAFQIKNVFIIALSRVEACEKIENLYLSHVERIPKLERIFGEYLDKRRLVMTRQDLPHIEVFSTELLDKTVKLSQVKLGYSKIVQIEGKPGVGKSHLVNHIEMNPEDILYRFWVSNQDINYRNRLEFNNFIFDLSKKLFNDLISRDIDEIIPKLEEKPRLLIIDGLDHVENYNNRHMEKFHNFLNYEWKNTKVIVFTRPLRYDTKWEKLYISNWNFMQVELYLDEMLMISDYSIAKRIYEISNGYPIIVSFLGKHYSEFMKLPQLTAVKDLNEYYNQLTREVSIKSALTIFLCTKSYLMKSEIELLLENPLSIQVMNEFLSEYPYLFEVKLNRVALIHDSFNTFIRRSNPDYIRFLDSAYAKVFTSLMDEETRFQSRFGLFNLSLDNRAKIIKKYANIDCFRRALDKCIDYEALRDFYVHIRNEISNIKPRYLSLEEYYDLGLILNILSRDHIGTLNGFLYTYVKVLLFNDYTLEDITSSQYLFGMFYYVIENNIDVLLRSTSDDHFGVDDFYTELLNDIEREEHYFDHLNNKICMSEKMHKFLSEDRGFNYHNYLVEILVNTYIHGTEICEIKGLECAINCYVDDKDIYNSYKLIEEFMIRYNMNTTFIGHTLKQAFDKLKGLGVLKSENEYINYSLKGLINHYKTIGSFNLREHIHNYIRLSLYGFRKVDIQSISKFFAMYYMRKDYTVINIDTALITLEKVGLVTPEISLKVIINAQALSEKGIRHILHSYVSKCSPSIIHLISDKYDLIDVNVRWLELPVEHIEMIDKQQFAKLLHSEFERRYIYSHIEYSDIENALNSNYKDQVLELIKRSGKSVKLSAEDPIIDTLLENGIKIGYSREDENKYERTHEEYLAKGILTDDVAYLIGQNCLSHSEVATYTNGNYCTLAELKLFEEFDSEIVREDISVILFGALNGKIRNLDQRGNLYYFVGNVVKLFYDYKCDVNWIRLFNSFMKNIEISLLNNYM